MEATWKAAHDRAMKEELAAILRSRRQRGRQELTDSYRGLSDDYLQVFLSRDVRPT